MTKTLYLYALAVCLSVACSTSAQQTPRTDAPQMPKGSNVNPDAGLVAAFTEKVQAYDKLRKDLAKDSPPLKETSNPAEIANAEKALAAKVRVARANAKPGDIFTPATAAMFRRLIQPPMATGPDAKENKAIIKEDAPKAGEVPFKINGEYPKEVPQSTVPPDVLKALPPLPEELQYRIVGKHLILLCVHGNLIIDYMLNAIP
ncbi:MAG TPA: hypothetical protein VM115_07820 [Vicinamibacterales bacterium]|nr:hypothetical protein [Vicinamibacterales bacterium]